MTLQQAENVLKIAARWDPFQRPDQHLINIMTQAYDVVNRHKSKNPHQDIPDAPY